MSLQEKSLSLNIYLIDNILIDNIFKSSVLVEFVTYVCNLHCNLHTLNFKSNKSFKIVTYFSQFR